MADAIEVPVSDTFETAAALSPQNAEVIILLVGSSDDGLWTSIQSVFSRALIPAAAFSHALLIDDGARTGLAATLGLAIEQADKSPSLMAIMASDAPPPDQYHACAIRLPTEWPDPDKGRFLIAAHLAANKSAHQKTMIVLLVGGGDSDKITAVRCARRCLPLLVVKGAGGLGDTILKAKEAVDAGGLLERIADPDIREIVEAGIVRTLDIAGDTESLKRVILGPVQKPGEILADAWQRYDDLDLEAIHKQRLFRSTQIALLALTVLATLIAILVTVFKPYTRHNPPQFQQLNQGMHLAMIIIPIGISLLVGFNARFREGNKWILLRASAESIKQHIFRYRARSGVYNSDQSAALSASARLASNIRDITSNLVQSEVNRTNLPGRKVQDETRTRFLLPEEYLHDRVEDQIGYFVKKTKSLYGQLKRLQTFILCVGGLGTFLAAISLDVWVALTTAMATALTNKLELDQVENSLVQYNTTLMSLRNIESWWKGLSPWERMRQKNIDLLVDQTETTLDHETAGWMQKMQSTLEKLTEKESNADQSPNSSKKS